MARPACRCAQAGEALDSASDRLLTRGIAALILQRGQRCRAPTDHRFLQKLIWIERGRRNRRLQVNAALGICKRNQSSQLAFLFCLAFTDFKRLRASRGRSHQ